MFTMEMLKGTASRAERRFIKKQIEEGKADFSLQYLQEAFGVEDFTHALRTTAHNSLMKGFGAVDPYWQLVIGKPYGKASDFKDIYVTRVHGVELLEKVKEGEKGSYTKPKDESEKYKVEVFNRFQGLTMQAMANDQLRILTKVFKSFGVAGVETLNKFVFGAGGLFGGTGLTMADGLPVFHADHNNTDTVANMPFNFENLGIAITQMRAHKDAAGNKMKIRPIMVLVEPNLEVTAAQLTASDVVLIHREITASSSVMQGGNKNPFKGKLQYHVIDDFDTGEWMLVADPNVRPVAEMSFYQGKTKPEVLIQRPGSDHDFYHNERDSRCQMVFGGCPLASETVWKATG